MKTLVDLLKGSAQRCGDSTALTITLGFRQQRWSYRRLWESSGRVAAWLAHCGLAKGDRALIWSVNRPEWVAAFFGCLRAGVIAVPLDVRSGPDFVARVVDQTSPKLAILSRQTPDGPLDRTVPVALLDELDQLVASAAPGTGCPDVAPDDLAEVMYTSGTTGEPKGVMLTHGNICANVLAAVATVPIRPSDRLLSLLPLSHMLEQTGGLLAPLHGGAGVVYPVSRQPTVIFKTLRANRVTHVVLVPQALQLFMDGIERQVSARGKDRQWRLLQDVATRLPMPTRRLLFRPVHRQLGGHLRFFMSGGAYLDPELQHKWGRLGIRVLQGYGTTEAAPVITTNSLDRQKPGSVGRVLAGQEVRISADGEVLTRGPNVTPGYWRNAAATAAAFADGWYKTGDLGVMDAEGFLFLKGRKKDLIVLPNGQNVYPEDIETALDRQPGVNEAIVLGMPSGEASIEVHAALLLADGADPAQAVRVANAMLADHQRIQGFTVWPDDDFPRTHTLKVKKPIVRDLLLRRRTADHGQPAAPPAATAAPRNDVHRIAAMVSEVPLDQIGDDSTLADDLGLDSLGRVELLSAVEQELGAYVDDDRIGPLTTLAELTALVTDGSPSQPMRFPSWGRTWWCRLLRAGLQHTCIFPALRLFYRVRITGQAKSDRPSRTRAVRVESQRQARQCGDLARAAGRLALANQPGCSRGRRVWFPAQGHGERAAWQCLSLRPGGVDQGQPGASGLAVGHGLVGADLSRGRPIPRGHAAVQVGNRPDCRGVADAGRADPRDAPESRDLRRRPAAGPGPDRRLLRGADRLSARRRLPPGNGAAGGRGPGALAHASSPGHGLTPAMPNAAAR